MNQSFFKGFLILSIIWIPFQNIKSQNLSGGDTLRIMSYNIRYAGDPQAEGLNSWDKRKDPIAIEIISQKAEIIGLQEALISQLNDLSYLLPGYEWTGVGRDDGDKKGEFSAIMYKKDKFELLSSKTFWLSPTPDTPSKGWDAALNRIATYARMKVKESGREFYLFNTHFDHIGKAARRESAKLLISRIKEITRGYPVILTGDFNDPPGSDFYKIITDYLNDSKLVSPLHTGPDLTFNGFNNDIEKGDIIDYIFVSDTVRVFENKIIAEKFEGRYPSDHFPVLAVIKF